MVIVCATSSPRLVASSLLEVTVFLFFSFASQPDSVRRGRSLPGTANTRRYRRGCPLSGLIRDKENSHHTVTGEGLPIITYTP